MTTRAKQLLALGLMLVALLWGGCANTPTWSNATAYQKEMGFFKADASFYNSKQYQQQVIEDVETVERLKQQIGHTNVWK